MMKKVMALSLALVLILGLAAGCGGGTEQTQAPASDAPASEAPASEAPSGTAEYTMSVASADGSGGIAHRGLQEFEKYVEEQSGGRIDVVIYMDGILGGEREALESVKLGSIQATCAGTASFSAYDERIAVVNLPFLYPDFDSFVASVEGEGGEALDEILAEQDIKALGYYASGLRLIGNNKHTIHTVDDLQGIKMRVPEQDIFLKMFEAMGTNPTPMSWTECYTGLQQGTIDGMECSPAAIYDSKLHEVLDYMTVTNHSIDTCILAVSPTWLASLPEDLQQIVIDGGKVACDFMNTTFDEESAKIIEEFAASGVEVTTLTDEERATFVEAVAPVYDEYTEIFGQELIDLFRSYSE